LRDGDAAGAIAFALHRRDIMKWIKRESAIPYDIRDVELGHHGRECSFDAFIDRYELGDPALATLAAIVRGADTDDRGLPLESAGLYAAATGFQTASSVWSRS
jgi:hypothetical protein